MAESAGVLIGRRAEVATLMELLTRVRAGQGAAVAVTGEAGIGKTALVDALAGKASKAGAAVAWGRCTDGESPPYWPWAQALRALGTDMPPAGRHAHRAALFATAVERLGRATASTPGVVILEDVHWADESSLALMRFVIDALPGVRLLLVATMRDQAGEAAHPALLDGLRPSVQRIALRGLDVAGSAVLIERVSGRRPDDERAREVQRRTSGNPFFVLEVARLDAARGDRAALDVPQAVRQVLSRRLARLAQPTMAVLEVAAVLGEPSVADLAVLTQQTPDAVADALAEAAAAGVVTTQGLGFGFAHALVRDTIYTNLAPSVRGRLHREAAAALEGRPGTTAAQLAMHHLHAGDAESRRRGAVHALAAARQASEQRAYEQAVRYYAWALEAGTDDAVSARVGLGEAQVLAGDLERGRDTLRGAARDALAERRGDDMARALLAMGAGVGGFEVDTLDDEQASLLGAALALLGEGDSALRAAALARYSLAQAWTADPGERVATARAAVEMARRVGDAAAEAGGLGALCDALAGPDHVRERLDAAGRMLTLAHGARDDVLVLLARRLRLVALLELGDLHAVDQEIARYTRLSDRLRIPLFAWPPPIWRGMRAAMEGDFEGALDEAERAEEIGRRAGSTNADLMVFSLRIAVYRARGAARELLDRYRGWLAGAEAYPSADFVLAALHAEAGDVERSRLHLRRVMARGLDRVVRDSEWIEEMWFLGEAAMTLDEPEAAGAVRDALRPYSALWAVDGIGGACLGPVADVVARLDAYLGVGGRLVAGSLAAQGNGRVDAAAAAHGREGAAAAREAASGPTPAHDGVMTRSGALWQVRFRGQAAVVADSKGMRDLALLVGRPGREVHVLELAGARGDGERVPREDGAGPLLDARARDEYRARLRELSGEIDAARAGADVALAARLAAERAAVEGELLRAFGLGGRARTAGDSTERARKAVTMRISTALRALDSALPPLGRHLRASVRTGRLCVYAPEQDVTWDLSADDVTRELTPSWVRPEGAGRTEEST